MLPQKPPQPSCSYLPFQAAPSGIQTSKLMIESLVGVAVPATRQKSGRPVNAVVAPGGVNDPPVTVCAAVIVACGSTSWARSSQLVAAAAGALASKRAATGAAARSRGLKRRLM